MENKELKIKLDNFNKSKYKKHLCPLVISETNQRKVSLPEVILGGVAKIYLQSSQINTTYHPMNPDTNVYRSSQFI